MGAIQIADNEDMILAAKQNSIETRVGKHLLTLYPKRQWYVSASDDCSTVEIRCADISMKYGMVIHTNKSTREMEKRVREASGELLERFNLSRKKLAEGDESDLVRTIDNEVLGAKTGEYLK